MSTLKNPATSWNSTPTAPQVSGSAYVDGTAVLIGDVRLEDEVYVAPGVSLRADEGSPIIVGSKTNVQDNVVMHALMGTSIEVGEECSIAHGAIVHGPCTIGKGSFVGFTAVVHNSRVGEKCFIGHGSLVIGVSLKNGAQVPNGAIVDTQDKADALLPATEGQHEFNHEVVTVNREFAKTYRLTSLPRAPQESRLSPKVR